MAKTALKTSASVVALARNNDDGAPEFSTPVDAIREAFEAEEGRNRELKLSDTVLDLVVSNCKNWDDMDDDEKMDFLEEAEKQAARVAIADPAISELAQVLNEDDHFNEVVVENLAAVKTAKSTALSMYAQFHRLYTLDQLNSFPRIGWKEKDVEGTNYKPDIVETTDKATGKPLTTVWSDDFLYRLNRGKFLTDELDDIKKEIRVSGSIPRLAKFGKKKLEEMRSDVSGDLSAFRSMMVRAIEIHHQFESVKGMAKVCIEWQLVEDTTKGIPVPAAYGTGKLGKDAVYVTKAPHPLWVYPMGKPADGKKCSITQLLNFAIPEAIANGGTMEDLFKTLSRQPEDPNGTGDGADWNEDEAYEGFNKLCNYINTRDGLMTISKILADEKNETRADWLENIGTIMLKVGPIYRKNRAAIEKAMGLSDDQKAVING